MRAEAGNQLTAPEGDEPVRPTVPCFSVSEAIPQLLIRTTQAAIPKPSVPASDCRRHAAPFGYALGSIPSRAKNNHSPTLQQPYCNAAAESARGEVPSNCLSRCGIWCPEPDSNRHGIASEGFSYSLQLSLLSLVTHLESGLSLCHRAVPYNTEH
jgi:hypothetical protein